MASVSDHYISQCSYAWIVSNGSLYHLSQELTPRLLKPADDSIGALLVPRRHLASSPTISTSSTSSSRSTRTSQFRLQRSKSDSMLLGKLNVKEVDIKHSHNFFKSLASWVRPKLGIKSRSTVKMKVE